jgi:hypothetical protein
MLPAVVEGHLDGCLLRVLWAQLGHDPQDLVIRDARGSGFWDEVNRYNAAARHQWVIGLGDLEQSRCASEALHRIKGGLHPNFKLRLSVRMLESWLLADRAALADFLGVPVALIPANPDQEPHPKRCIGQISARSRKRRIRETMAPAGTGAAVGAEYTPVIKEFIAQAWSMQRAVARSPSLARACQRWAIQAAT